MILHALRFKGISVAFPEREVALDFDTMPGPLVAIVGENGVGKTHLLELAGPGTVYREFSSYREAFLDHVAPGVRDAFAELTFTIHDTRYQLTVQADPESAGGRGKTEARLNQWAEAGSPSSWTPIAGPLVGAVDEALARLFPPKELFLASVFACQATAFGSKGGTRSFFALEKAARKDLFAALLGLEHLQHYAEASAERAKRVLVDLERVRQDCGPVERRAARLAELVILIGTASETRADAEEAEAAARATHDTATTALATARAAQTSVGAEVARLEAERTRLTKARDGAQQRVGALTVTRDRAAALLADRDTIEAAAARVRVIDGELAALDTTEREARVALEPIVGSVAMLTAQRQQLVETAARLRTAHAEAVAAQTRVDAARDLEAEATAQRAKAEELAAALAAASREVLVEAEAAEATTLTRRRVLTASRDELAPRTGLLATVPGVPECALCPLTEDARAAAGRLAIVDAELAALPVIDGTPAKRALAEYRAREAAHGAIQRWLTAQAPALARVELDRPVGAQAAEVQAELDRVIADGATMRAALDAKTAEQRTAQEQLARIGLERRDLTAERTRLVPDAARAEGIAAAVAEQAQTETALAEAQAQVVDATTALAALPPAPDVAGAAAAVQAADAAAATAGQTLRVREAACQAATEAWARLDGERGALGDPAAELAALRAREAALVTAAADWALLERTLGRDGVQAISIDAAGPAVTARANDLLYACYGPRFQIALETTAPKADGRGQKEVFEVRILDSEAGRGEATKGSGGEMVLLDEALRLALALFNAEQSGFELRTLYRDEPTGALSPANAERYLAMLRRAMDVGSFDRCLFIAHQREVFEQADHRLFLHGGQVYEDVRAFNAALEAADAA